MINQPATARGRYFSLALGIEIEIKEFPANPRTAQQVADAVNGPLGSSKSLLFIAEE